MSHIPPGADFSDPALGELQTALRQQEVVLFVGAGISIAAGLPGWHDLARALLERARLRSSSSEAIDEIDAYLKKDRLIDALSALRQALGKSEYYAVIEQQLNDRNKPIPEVARALADLEWGLRAVWTTNLDHLLERSFTSHWPALARVTGDLGQRTRYIFKAHGTLFERDTWVFTRQQYDRALFDNQQLRSAFEALYSTRTILFVGFGLADDDLEYVLARTRALAGDQPPRHFALVAAGAIRSTRRAQLEGAGIRLIEYDNPDRKHHEMVRILKKLAANTFEP